MNSNKPVGLIGLGLVGTSLAARFINAGFSVYGFDTDEQRCEELSGKGVLIAASAADITHSADRIVLSLPNSDVVKDVLIGQTGIFPASQKSLLIIDTTTGDPAMTVEIARNVRANDGNYIDACIIGSSKQVLDGNVVVTVGGDETDIGQSMEILQSFSHKIVRMGPAGKGIQAKLVANLVLGLHRLVLSEGLLFAEALDLDLPAMLEVLKSGGTYSRVMDTKGRKMLEKDFEPEARLAQHLKDVNLIVQTGLKLGVALPLSTLHQNVLQTGTEMGLGGMDNAAVIEALRKCLTQKKDQKS